MVTEALDYLHALPSRTEDHRIHLGGKYRPYLDITLFHGEEAITFFALHGFEVAGAGDWKTGGSKQNSAYPSFSKTTSKSSTVPAGKGGLTQFTHPVIVLTDKITVSAAEVMLIYLKALPHVTQIGTATSGDFSDTGMRRFLPNGWQYQYSIMTFLLPDGVTSLDGVGHVPDV